jgi:transposase
VKTPILTGADDWLRPFAIVRNTKALSQRIATMGATLMLTNHPELDHVKILELYRRKDYLEKIFDVLKNEFDGKRLRGHSKDVINGRLFIKFISLILYSALANKREKKIFLDTTASEKLCTS